MAAEASGLRIRLLGAVTASRDGTEAGLGSAHRRAVLAVLAGHAGQVVSLSELVAAVWGDEAPASAVGNLYTYVSTLRRVLDPDRAPRPSGSVLVSGAGGYRLRIEPGAVDAHRFAALRETARHRRDAGDGEGELAALESALALWHGDEALAGVPGPYAETERHRLGELRLATAERRGDLLLALGRPADAATGLADLAARHPRRRRLQELTAEALARAGEAAAAAQPATLIGRDAERRLLGSALATLVAGHGGHVWIDGEPGSGKSALIALAVGAAARLGCRVGAGVGDEPARRMPLGVLLQCFEDAGIASAGHRNALLGSLRTAAELTGNPTLAVLDTACALVRTACAERPLVLVLDDLQWADESSLVVWHALHALAGELPLLLLSAARPVPARRAVDLVRAALPSAGATVLALPPLPDADAAALVRRAAPAGLDAARVAAVVRQAGGNPCYLRHLAAAPDPLPAALLATITGHLDALAGDTRLLLRAVAFLGEPCPVADLPAVTGRAVPALLRAADEAIAAGLLVERGAGLAFRHPIVRLALRDGTAATHRGGRIGGRHTCGPRPPTRESPRGGATLNKP